MSAYFVSDLHLFTRRSVADRHVAALHQAASRAEAFLFGGDIFDFKWSRWPTLDETLDAAEAWLADFVRPHPHCRFHFLLGNHDAHPRFEERLVGLAERLTNFAWHPNYLRLGDCIFLHGDVADRPMDQAGLDAARSRWHATRRKGPIANGLYDLLVATRLHRVPVIWFHPPQRTAERIAFYLDSIGQGAASGVRRVYFGHTHAVLSDFQHGGLRFFNGGAAIRGLRFQIVEVEP